MESTVKVLLIGSGGREHALAWKLEQSPRVSHIFVAPGNGGIAASLSKVSCVDLGVDAFEALVEFAQQEDVTLVVPGPEVPLVNGIEAHFRRVGIPCFGPSLDAARMEGSKAFSKDFMLRHSIPTAAYRVFEDHGDAAKYLDSISHRVVIKASGLAAGKGVIIPESHEEALVAIKDIMQDKSFGAAGDEVVIEEYLEGDELSILTFSDGHTIKSLPPAQDHKRIGEGDTGPNTGGMGCYAPTDIVSAQQVAEIDRNIIQPTIDGMRKDRMPFVGLLFTGIMMTSSGPKVLEYNVRFGDPETQTVIPLLDAKCDLAEIMLACTSGWLDAIEMKVQQLYATTVILAAGGYPGSYAKGNEIKIGPMDAETHVFHAGTDRKNDRLVTAGGRVIAVTATGSSLKQAVARAYEGVKSIKFDNMVFRTDIAHRALASRPQIPRGLTYADAGVSIAAGASLVDRIKAAVKSTRRPGADAEIGGFGGAFDLSAAGWGQDTIILGAIDGVGTKLKIAQAMKRHDTVGIDLVAMNVNDLVVQGAESLFFLDCFSCGSLDIDTAAEFVMGVAEGCKLAGCALIGGETAEMPGMYQGEDYDAVGAAIGAVKKTKILPRTSQMKAGDLIIGLASSGLHSNGFSLVRKIIERSELSYTSAAPWNPARSVGEELLSPTTIYAKALPPFLQHDFVHGLAHITGGGLLENVPRVLPDHLAAAVDTGSWQRPAVFEWLQKNGGVSEGECFKTWNMGIGMVLVCDPAVERHLAELDRSYAARIIGRLVERSEHPGCFLTNSLAT